MMSDFDAGDNPTVMYAVWTTSPVPLPAVAGLFISAATPTRVSIMNTDTLHAHLAIEQACA